MTLEDDVKIEDWFAWTKSQQLLASDPTGSAWVSANAGSGKTHILVQRVLRLLLADVNPSTILCLTHTKAATAEMSHRVIEIITEWSHLSDENLSSELMKIQDKKPNVIDLSKARHLLVKILETPGGIKVQTIHSFCEAIIRQFPLEANITGHSCVLEEDQAKKMIEAAQKEMLSSIMIGTDVKLKQAFTELDISSEEELESLVAQIINNRNALHQFSADSTRYGGEKALLKKRLGISPDENYDIIYSDLWPLSDCTEEDIKKYIALSRADNQITFVKKADILENITKTHSREDRFNLLSGFFLTQKLTPQKRIIAQSVIKKSPDLKEKIVKSQEKFIQVLERLNTYNILQKTLALLTLAQDLNTRYEELKKKYSFLDFNDLIVYTHNLLKKNDVNAWIRYKLDQEINHILIDEVQDTSLIQWDIIRFLTEDFFVGKNAHENPRTLFAVGDEKQSIFSFHGADPSRFFHERKINQQRITNAGQKFSIIQLPLSFRSTADILTAVDKVFSIPENSKGLSEDNNPILHRSNRIGHAGSVLLWEQVHSQEIPVQEDWISNFDSPPQESSSYILARRIAQTISDMIGSTSIIRNGKKRFVCAEDILILVHRRKDNPFIEYLTRFLKKNHKISVSGRDRFTLTDNIAIKDLMALGLFMLSQEDDLSLAALLKSPIFNLSEDDLFMVCSKREKTETVYASIKRLASDGILKFRHIAEYIQELIVISQSHSPYDFFSLILGAKNARKQFVSRFGAEVIDVLDEFLRFALKNEQIGSATLQEFISELELYPPTIHRKPSLHHSEVRIMTVHSAKGLESPVVFLIDNGSEAFSSKHLKKMYMVPSSGNEPGAPIWIPKKESYNRHVSQFLDGLKIYAQEEYHRLLYVAMTRASDRLIICNCANNSTTTTKKTWYNMVYNAFQGDERVTEIKLKTSKNTDEWTAFEWRVPCNENIDIEDITEESLKPQLASEEKIPKELFLPLQNKIEKPPLLTPSMLNTQYEAELISPLADKDPSDALAIKRGHIIHRLLQTVFALPLEQKIPYVMSWCKKHAQLWSTQEHDNLLLSIKNIVNHPIISTAMSCDHYEEVSISGKIHFAQRSISVSGRIDQISISQENVFILEYKTHRHIPQEIENIPLSHVTQLAMYREILKRSYPQKAFICLLIYVLKPQIFIIPQYFLDKEFLKIEEQFSNQFLDSLLD
ncbi:MAG: double-strand break repair helicase AddA [Candidatus Liberibacter ctenarytainae]|uniref:DNA 3'-5' helicase n=1 Tax=Candidatus Liberibacter ctenarytainae TaxID=2020335 RepID=A0A937DGS6_9HYPH|nr:double-strand break repair helicase AddA [Candidatus Liberibacter ctenarytainae]